GQRAGCPEPRAPTRRSDPNGPSQGRRTPASDASAATGRDLTRRNRIAYVSLRSRSFRIQSTFVAASTTRGPRTLSDEDSETSRVSGQPAWSFTPRIVLKIAVLKSPGAARLGIRPRGRA